jgi:hypothetical protein
MNRALVVLFIAGMLALSFALYRWQEARKPGLEPHAAEEIRKAQQR